VLDLVVGSRGRSQRINRQRWAATINDGMIK
jgi:hypothetical protein